MIKKIIKFFIYLFGVIVLASLYLSFIGLETNKFNQLIKNEISQGNKKLEIELKSVKILLKISNLSINLKVVDPVLIFDEKKIELKQTESNLSIISYINKNFSINNLLISTKDIELQEVISIVRSYKNSPELFILQKIIKKGYLAADININFDEKGKIKKDYKVKGLVKNGKIKLLNKKTINDLNFNFQIKNNEYQLKDISTEFNQVKFSSKLISIKDEEKIFYVNGFFKNIQSDIKIGLLESLLKDYYKNIDNLNFSSDNKFSFNIDKKFKVKNIKINSKINLNKLDFKINVLNFKKYLPNLKKKIRLNDHLIKLSFKEKVLNISGKGNFLIDNKLDILEYKFIKKNDSIFFDTKIIFEKNPLLIDFLKYEKEKNVQALLKIEGLFKKKEYINFNKISLEENNNHFLIEGLSLNEKLKINQIDKIKINFLNNDKIDNKISLSRNKENYNIKGKIFDVSYLLDKMLEDNDNKSISKLLNNFNSTIKIKIDKTHLDKISFLNNTNGSITLKKGGIVNLNLVSNFSDNKELKFTINTNDNNEKITTLFSGNAKPLVKRYKFIKGFEEGSLDFYSTKKDTASSSKLKIYDFKLNELPALTKILTLASLQGIADLLTGEGIRFNDFEMTFSNKGKLMTIDEIYAIGPAISILMDGYIENDKLVSLSGTLVPATTINKFIGSIPILGNILVGKKTGEGVFGVSFKIKGPPKDLKTTVNPIKTLTPRFITRTLEKIKKN